MIPTKYLFGSAVEDELRRGDSANKEPRYQLKEFSKDTFERSSENRDCRNGFQQRKSFHNFLKRIPARRTAVEVKRTFSM